MVNGPSGEKAKKERVRKAAQKVFSRRGFAQSTVQEIADEARVAVGTLYNHFDDKEDIFLYMFEVEMNERQATINSIIDSDLAMREKFKQIIAFQLERAHQNKHMVRLALCEEHHLGGKIEMYMNQLFKELPHKVSLVIAESIGRGEMRKIDPHIAAYALMGATRAVIARSCLYNDDDAKRFRERSAEALADFLWEGLKPVS